MSDGYAPFDDEATAIRSDVGECIRAGDHDVIGGLCIHCGAEFEDDEPATP